MSDDVRKETERIHQGIVESLSFSEALAKRDAEIERLKAEKESWVDAGQAVIDSLRSEIERLRELLQWWLDAGPDADWDDYEKRVREALGDK